MKLHRLAAVAALGVLAVSCVSDPSPNRVAEDLIKTLASTPEEEECMLDVLGNYDVDDLGEEANNGDLAAQADANAQLDAFQADLEACRAQR